MTPVRIDRSGQPVRQELLYLRDWYKPGMVPKARPVPLARRPDRVWTLYFHEDPDKPPELPFDPRHQHNAFLEDCVHDWNWWPQNGGVFDYASRLMDRPVWLLLEYAVEDPAPSRPRRAAEGPRRPRRGRRDER